MGDDGSNYDDSELDDGERVARLESLGLLAEAIAHDFNNLLVGVLGNASLALREMPRGAPARPYVQSIHEAARRAAGLARQLLACIDGENAGEGAAEGRAASGASAAVPAWPEPARILVVDDEHAVRIVVSRLLGHLGFTVLQAADGEAALRSFDEHERSLTVVLLDLTMPKIHGSEVFRSIRARRPEIPIVLASGYDDGDDLGDLLSTPNTAYVPKPFTLETLRETLRRVLSIPE